MFRKSILTVIMLVSALLSPVAFGAGRWTGTWATAQEAPGNAGDMPASSLAGRSLRQVIHVSLGGEKLRLQLSNEFSNQPLEIKSVYIADAAGGSEIAPSTAKYLTFGKKKSVVIPAGEALYSDPLDFPLDSLQLLSITVNYGNSVPEIPTTHRGSRTNSYIMKGVSSPKKPFVVEETLPHWYNIAKIEVLSDAPCVAVIGDSLTDGRGSTTDAQDRWTDALAEALDGKVGVLNLGIGGNALLAGGLSQPGLVRFDRDVLAQQGITHVIVLEGTNDIGGTQSGYEQLAARLVDGYKEIARKARDAGCKVFIGTITPTFGSDYYSYWHDAVRHQVNEWIRSTDGVTDGFIDFDQAVKDPSDSRRLLPEYSSDWLHLNPEGYKVMGKTAATCLTAN